jgi:hypothetical protein
LRKIRRLDQFLAIETSAPLRRFVRDDALEVELKCRGSFAHRQRVAAAVEARSSEERCGSAAGARFCISTHLRKLYKSRT